MRFLNDNELLVVGGGGTVEIAGGCGMIGVGAVLLTLGILGFTPLRPGNVGHRLLTFERYIVTDGGATLLDDTGPSGMLYTNAPVLARCSVPCAHLSLWVGLALIANGVTTLATMSL